MSDIQFKVDQSTIRAAIAAEISRMDELAEKASLQILIEGKNVAKALVRKDTHGLEQSIDSASSVTRTAPCIFTITLANGMDYGEYQEYGPKEETKKKWLFRPHVRPGAMIMQVKAGECIDRVFGD